jgi:hypothetical protein
VWAGRYKIHQVRSICNLNMLLVFYAMLHAMLCFLLCKTYKNILIGLLNLGLWNYPFLHKYHYQCHRKDLWLSSTKNYLFNEEVNPLQKQPIQLQQLLQMLPQLMMEEWWPALISQVTIFNVILFLQICCCQLTNQYSRCDTNSTWLLTCL